MKKIIIIGGGPSGMFCAMAIKENYPDCQVTILERLEKVGKKLLATGNGKCNFTNNYVKSDKYNDPTFVNYTLNIYTPEEVIAYLNSIGLMSKTLTEGRVYPYSESASVFVDVLRQRLHDLKVEVKCGYEVAKVVFKDNRYLLYNKSLRNTFVEADYVVFATGGEAAQVLGSNGSGYTLLKGLKVKCEQTYPGLVGLKSDQNICKVLNGLRVKGKVSLIYKKTKKVAFSEVGEIQFKNEGLSGIVVMQASTYIARHPGNYFIRLDFMPDVSGDEVYKMINNRIRLYQGHESSQILNGIFSKMLNTVIIKKSGINLNSYVDELNKQSIVKIANMIKAFDLPIEGNYGFDKAQVTVGGICLDEIDSSSMQIKRLKRAYITGEVMNIDGECGGYNIHWAIATGRLVGKHIAMVLKEEKNA